MNSEHILVILTFEAGLLALPYIQPFLQRWLAERIAADLIDCSLFDTEV